LTSAFVAKHKPGSSLSDEKSDREFASRLQPERLIASDSAGPGWCARSTPISGGALSAKVRWDRSFCWIT